MRGWLLVVYLTGVVLALMFLLWDGRRERWTLLEVLFVILCALGWPIAAWLMLAAMAA